MSLIKRGDAKETLREIEMEAQKREREKNWEKARAAYRVAGLLAESLGSYQKAITYAERDLEITKKYLWRGKEKEPRARESLYLLAKAYLAVNDHGRTMPLIEEALSKFYPESNTKDENLYADLNGMMGDIYRTRGDLKAALTYHAEALRTQESVLSSVLARKRKGRRKPLRAVYQGIGAKDRYLRCLTALARDHLALGEYQNSSTLAERLLQMAKEFGYRDWEGEGYRLLGDIGFRSQHETTALSNYQRALSLGEKFSTPEVTLWSHVGIARVYVTQGKSSRAMEHLERAMGMVDAGRSLLQSEELRSSYFEDKALIYSEAVRAQLQLGRDEQAFHTAERARSRAFLDLLGTKVSLSKSPELIAPEMELRRKLAELRLSAEAEEEDEQPNREEIGIAQRAYNEFLVRVGKENREQASLMTVEPLTLRQAQELLDPGQTLLEYFVTPEKTLLWVVDKDTVATLSFSISRKNLTAKLNSLRQAISELKPVEEYKEAAHELYTLLIQPALSHIKGREIIVVPHDVLHYLPFQALHSPQGKYLIEDYSLSYLSSASLLQFTRAKRKANGERVLAFGNPDLGDPKMELRFAVTEVREIAELYPHSTVLLEKEATKRKAKTLSPQNDVLHFATHTELNEDDPLSSAIRLAKDGKEDGRLEVREIFGMVLKASLVVLSGCETGLGKLSSGDELVGLTRAFIYAGTPSVVASLWKVDDSSTAALMENFYRNLKTMTKVEALRQAQLKMIREEVRSDLLALRGVGGIGKLGKTPTDVLHAPGSEPHAPISISTAHPYFWAAFILVGDGK